VRVVPACGCAGLPHPHGTTACTSRRRDPPARNAPYVHSDSKSKCLGQKGPGQYNEIIQRELTIEKDRSISLCAGGGMHVRGDDNEGNAEDDNVGQGVREWDRRRACVRRFAIALCERAKTREDAGGRGRTRAVAALQGGWGEPKRYV
jgi:hypothetical protein